MTLKSRPTYFLQERIVDQDGKLTPVAARAFQDIIIRCDLILTNVGQIQPSAPVVGRTEGIGTTVSNLTATGQLNNLTNVAAGRTTDNISDGTGSPLTGGKRGFQALDTNNRLAGSSKNNALNVTSFFTSSNPLSQSGVTTLILVGASSRRFGDGLRSYNSGSVDPGALGGWTVFADDPTFAGGAVTYQATQTNNTLSAADGRLNFGSITTAGGGGGSGIGGGDGDFPPRLL
jgi:hypothetical protein